MNKAEELFTYLDTLYGGSEGWIYAPVKNSDGKFEQEFFRWPHDKAGLVAKVLAFQDKGDLYAGIALYGKPGNATKSGIIHSNTVWVEFDGNYDSVVWDDIPQPSLEICSSVVGRMHCYWRLLHPLPVADLESITRGLCYRFRGDPSGWDATQILRPPGTYNSKHGVRTRFHVARPGAFGVSDFSSILSYGDVSEIPIGHGTYPDAAQVIGRHQLPERAIKILFGGFQLDDRSKALMELGYILAESGLTNDEMMSVLLFADDRIGKFIGRTDRITRIEDIVRITRHKYPEKVQPKLHWTKDAYQIVESEVEVEWVWENLLQLDGTLVLSGAPAAGKSQLTLDALAHISTGTPFLGFPTKKMKVGFASLEMGELPLKNILQKQLLKWGKNEELRQNLKIWDLGQALYLDTKEGQNALEDWIRENELKGVALDALSATSGDAFSDEKAAKTILDWLISIKIKYGCFIWLIHHNRKATAENKKPHSLDDVFGSRVITARVDNAVVMYRTKKGIVFSPVKTRLSGLDETEFIIRRGDNLNFTRDGQNPTINVVVTPTENAPTGGFLGTFGFVGPQ